MAVTTHLTFLGKMLTNSLFDTYTALDPFCCLHREAPQDDNGTMIEKETMCLLDFYVHESVQRQGLGLDLFKSALKVGYARGSALPSGLDVKDC